MEKNSRFDRYDLYTYLRTGDYIPMVHYIPVHLLGYFRKRFGYKRGNFPIAENYYDRPISIPLYPSLTDGEVMKVVDDITSFIKSS